jgi:hypothetical protein
VTSGCTMPCAGNSSELCGGPARLNAYNNTAFILDIPMYGTWESIGCYRFVSNGLNPSRMPNFLLLSDNVNARTLVNQLTVTGSMTVEKCLAACQASNFSFSGLEYRQQCCMWLSSACIGMDISSIPLIN